ncbi:hypothetical protein Hanom_Chr09g00830601 [Helianthus anomalus]
MTTEHRWYECNFKSHKTLYKFSYLHNSESNRVLVVYFIQWGTGTCYIFFF